MPATNSPETLRAERGFIARRNATTELQDWQPVALLGAGRWCTTYRARPADIGASGAADYVVKVSSAGSEDREFVRQMLRREAGLGQAIRHPNLVTVLASQIDAPPHYVVMPYVLGATLREVLDAGISIPVAHALWIARQVAEGVCALHSQGWLHGDIKPQNIHVSEQGHATLLDLGFACRIRKTRAHLQTFAGTPHYAAPERFTTSLPIGRRSDLYSIGVMLYEMLSGQTPFLEQGPQALAARKLRGRPQPLRAKRPQVSKEVCELVTRLLAKEPLRRPHSAAELVDLLRRLEIDELDVG